MTRKKLKHFAQMKEWSHVLEPTSSECGDLKGTWGDRVILELACGKGAYTLALAERDLEATVVGVDIKGSRMWHGAGEALEMENVKFLRTRIEDLGEYFGEGEVDEIWITFPDPHPRKGKAKKRLTGPRFLEIYRRVLKPGGKLHLKTDDEALFRWSLEVLEEEGWKLERVVEDVYKVDDEVLHIKTDYEKRWIEEGRTIRYLEARV
jgi:tRNA (guanine-N7-)-methyltransferase